MCFHGLHPNMVKCPCAWKVHTRPPLAHGCGSCAANLAVGPALALGFFKIMLFSPAHHGSPFLVLHCQCLPMFGFPVPSMGKGRHDSSSRLYSSRLPACSERESQSHRRTHASTRTSTTERGRVQGSFIPSVSQPATQVSHRVMSNSSHSRSVKSKQANPLPSMPATPTLHLGIFPSPLALA